ncbi:adenylate/guanylate cyclase domain-containing protein [Microvirga puerhi]|uniref:Adenylate/guanylate cyclase domain-containing protein n=1 Tax=Microvirga puerhi TaxID=2876078 RepID=A0ABS7VGW6_9HYPH|nr:adenylate/guanylate cyclase domain-containing protein [Microvirga puerhi]MBZ6074743.1 adenylate/guanylate cyclase domain-containing protein [Microvirga puerhi]
MDEDEKLLSLLRQSADSAAVDIIERLIHDGQDRDLNHVNVLALAAKEGFDEERLIATFLQSARLGLFELSWSVLCPGCGGVLDAGTSLKTVTHESYHCALCGAGYEPTLDEMVEVTFTISPRVRRIAAHDPDTLPMWDYVRQFFWSSGVDLPDDETFRGILDDIVLDSIDLPPGERASLSLQLPAGFIIVFEPVTHEAQFIEVKGEPTRERQTLSIIYNGAHTHNETIILHPGPLRLSLENRSSRRVLPAIWIADDRLHALLGRRRPFLTAKRLLSNQTFRDLYRTDTLDIDQRLKITSLTFLFTDLKGSTELYERVGDLVAYDLVREHFRVLHEIVAAEAGAVVKTIGDAVMATFPTPDHALAAALHMREAMRSLNEQYGREDLLLKIGIHEGPCLAVMLNDRQDYFGQTVNIASRVQSLALSRSIFATGTVVEDPNASRIIAAQGLHPTLQKRALRGMSDEFAIYEIP